MKREAELWHDPEFQKKLGLKYDATYHTDTILDQQRRVLAEFGVKDLEIVGILDLVGLKSHPRNMAYLCYLNRVLRLSMVSELFTAMTRN